MLQPRKNTDETYHISKFHILSALNFGIFDSSAKLTDAENWDKEGPRLEYHF
jgi:hypothetical protein